MTSPGYPDYTRYTRSGNQQLFFMVNNSVLDGQQLFKGYVGSWPYTGIFMDCRVNANSTRIEMIYYDDSTFTNVVGFRYAIRQGSQFSSVVYGNMSDWLIIQAHQSNSGSFAFFTFGAYATEGYSPVIAQDSMDVPLLGINSSVGATTTSEFGIQHVHPGPATMFINSAATSWQYKVRYYDYNSDTIKSMAVSATFSAPAFVQFDCPQLDAPMFLDLINNDAVPRNFFAYLLASN